VNRRAAVLQLGFRAWRAGDERAFTPRPDMAADAAAVDWVWSERGEPGPTWSLLRATGEVVGMGGGVEQAPGSWMLWSVLAPMPWRHWPSALACARLVIQLLERDWGAEHFTALARTDFPGAHRVLQRLGFSRYDGPDPPWAGYVWFQRRVKQRRAA
jgi:RimJ/RimL family protein N-acetyltransferase